MENLNIDVVIENLEKMQKKYPFTSEELYAHIAATSICKIMRNDERFKVKEEKREIHEKDKIPAS